MSSTVIIRTATELDIPSLGSLIKESFFSLSEHYGDESHHNIWHNGANDVLTKDLNEEQFEKEYFTQPGGHFWVAECDSKVVGCVGVKRVNTDEMELVRMSVSGASRSLGVGSQIVSALLAHCREHKICRVLLHTANPRAATFYTKCGFRTIKKFQVPINVPDLTEITMNVWSMVCYLGAKIVRRVALVGGTHGNELLGIELVKRWQLNQSGAGPSGVEDELKRSTFSVMPVLSNLPAICVNRRFIDKDLNRQFKRETLDTILKNTASPTDAHVDSEDYCATRLNELLGPKTEFYTIPTAVDFIIDMHSSTSNLGNMLILGCLTHDNLAAHVAYNVQKSMYSSRGDCLLKHGQLRVASTDVTKEVSHWVDSIAPGGLAIEVGPLAHGTMNASHLEDTRRIVLSALDYLEQRNLAILTEAQHTVDARAHSTTNSASAAIDAACGDSSGACAQLASEAEWFDFATTTYVSADLAPTAIIPQGISVSGGEETHLNYYYMAHPLLFPNKLYSPADASAAVGAVPSNAAPYTTAPGTVSHTKLSEALQQIANTPAKEVILHASLDNKDWEPLHENTPLFQAINGTNTVTPFSRAVHAPSIKENENAYPVFINEAAYQSSNMAFWIVKDAKYTLY